MSQRELALVTGASMGIGRSLATLFASEGKDLVLVARSEDKLQALASELEGEHGVTAHVVAADLTAADAPERIFETLESKNLELDYLVNNAGFGTSGPFKDASLKSQRDMLQVNIDAVVALTHLALQGMVARGRGRILNIASSAGFQPGPLMSVYYASKSFVILFSEGVANEVRSAGVTVTAHCPGATATNFADTAGNAKSVLFKLGAAPVERVARHAYRAMMAGRVVAVEGLINKIGVFSVRFSPRAMVRKLTRWLNT
ncbi:MAG: SDR family oxidoreductase [Myxococcota bacterium]